MSNQGRVLLDHLPSRALLAVTVRFAVPKPPWQSGRGKGEGGIIWGRGSERAHRDELLFDKVVVGRERLEETQVAVEGGRAARCFQRRNRDLRGRGRNAAHRAARQLKWGRARGLEGRWRGGKDGDLLGDYALSIDSDHDDAPVARAQEGGLLEDETARRGFHTRIQQNSGGLSKEV